LETDCAAFDQRGGARGLSVASEVASWSQTFGPRRVRKTA